MFGVLTIKISEHDTIKILNKIMELHGMVSCTMSLQGVPFIEIKGCKKSALNFRINAKNIKELLDRTEDILDCLTFKYNQKQIPSFSAMITMTAEFRKQLHNVLSENINEREEFLILCNSESEQKQSMKLTYFNAPHSDFIFTKGDPT